ncbi:MAG: LLM class flavin-dependent oxidoreductase [Candidatus Tectomicrobia bacterium]|nr:LLM class flavin-dependent oxidoreductase [Candidatus Tectomicrobia bacterium]
MKIYGFHLMPWPYLKERSEYPDANSLYDPRMGHRVYNEYLDQLEAFEDYGFDGICFNEHHSVPYGGMPSPNIIAAAIARRTKKLRIAIVGNLPALHGHPLRLAEELAMLDVITGGRMVSGFVRGIPTEYYAYSQRATEARERIEEAVDLIVKAWTERQPFAWHGKFFTYDHVSIWPRPLQQPHPPIIYPAQTPDSQEIAAKRRWPSGIAYRSTAASKPLADNFRALARTYGWEPTLEDLSILRFVYVSESNAQAREEAKEHMDYFWQKLFSMNLGILRLEGGSAPRGYESNTSSQDRQFWEIDYDFANASGISICGDPDFVTEQILRQQDEIGVGTFMLLFQFGSLPHNLAMKNLDLFARHVLPELRKQAPVQAPSSS